jgi:crotonobetainyl-CoA:carnitine CoA-transferase CaiB-like acyl-CoA transferase
MATLGIDARRERRREIDAVLAAWAQSQHAERAAVALREAGVPASALASALDLVGDAHLRERGFWDPHPKGVLPGLPWRASFARAAGPAPGLGADTDVVLRDVLGMSDEKITALRASGAFG